MSGWPDTSRLPHAVWVTTPDGWQMRVWATPEGELLCSTGRVTTTPMDEALLAALLGETWESPGTSR